MNFTEESLKEGKIFLFDKPYGWTSFDLVNKVRRLLCIHAGIKKLKVGHAGTLDPLATGLLILCVGKATRKIEAFQGMPKEYFAAITFGATTPSFDMETEIDKEFSIEHISNSFIKDNLEHFKGKIEQIPPLFSAKKLAGVRAYELAREGMKRELEPVPVEILELELLSYNSPVAELRIKCSKGTYIRSLARDLGKKLDSGGYLSALRRTAIGAYTVEQAYNLENFQKKLNFL